MKTIELKTPWCVYNDGSQLFKDTVIKYLNEIHGKSVYDGNGENQYYGIDYTNRDDYFAEPIWFGADVTIYSIEDFIKLTSRNILYKKYHNNGNLSCEGKIENGVPEGLWFYYYSNGNVWKSGNYEKGKEKGFWKFFHDNNINNVKSQGSYNNGKKIGKWKEFYEYGDLYCMGKYENEKRYGIWKFYKNGEIIEQVNYVNDKREGKFISFYSKNHPAIIGNYKNDKEDGFWKCLYKNGKEKNNGYYKDGKKEGIWCSYNEYGEIINNQTYGEMINNEKHEKIIGYECPHDLFNGRIKKGEIFSEYSEKQFVMYNKKHMTSGVPMEIVKTWKPLYEDVILKEKYNNERCLIIKNLSFDNPDWELIKNLIENIEKYYNQIHK
jgi:antitoxin component YwqK of YwqJK toxin-antitoxin module